MIEKRGFDCYEKMLLDGAKPFFKANLHCHSTISDGSKTPEELKAMYAAQGYSVLAYTDHDVLLDHSDLCDEHFLALNGYEMEVNETGENFAKVKTCHMCFIARKPDNLRQVCYHREDYLFGNAPKYRHLLQYAETAPLTQASFAVNADDCYVRVTVTDQCGKHANTNAYFIEDLNK